MNIDQIEQSDIVGNAYSDGPLMDQIHTFVTDKGNEMEAVAG